MVDDGDSSSRNESTQAAAIDHLPALKRLRTLVLKDYGNMEVREQFGNTC